MTANRRMHGCQRERCDPTRAAALLAVVIAELNNVEAGFAPAIAVERARIEVELQRLIEVAAAALGVSAGAQLQLNADGTMVFVAQGIGS